MKTPTARAAKMGDNNPPSTMELMQQKHPEIFERKKKWLRTATKLAANLDPQTLDDCLMLERVYRDGVDIANDADSIRTKEKDEPLRLCKEIDATFNGGIRDEIGAKIKGGLAERIVSAAAAKRLEITRAEQAAAAAKAQKEFEEAERLQRQADAKAEKGNNAGATVAANKAEAVLESAQRLDAAASQSVAAASRMRSGGLTSSVNAVLVCEAINKPELDLETLRPFLKEDDLIAAVNAYIKMGNKTLKGAIIVERAKASVRR